MTANQPPIISDVEPLREHRLNPNDLIVAGIRSLPVIDNFAAEVASNALGTGQNSAENKLIKLQINWLVDQIPEISKKLDSLLQKVSQEELPESSDVGAVFEAALEVSRKTTEFKKRNFLKRAVVNAFDENLYKSGIVLILMEILEKIQYGEIELLQKLASESQSPKDKLVKSIGNPNSIKYYHLKKLEEQNLVFIFKKRPDKALSESPRDAHIIVSELGQDLLKFIAD